MRYVIALDPRAHGHKYCTVCIHMIHAALGVVLCDKNCHFLPIFRAREELDDAAERVVVVGHVALAIGVSIGGTRTVGVVVGQVDEEESRQFLTALDVTLLNLGDELRDSSSSTCPTTT